MTAHLKTLTLATRQDLSRAVDHCLYLRKETNVWALMTDWDVFDLAYDFFKALDSIVYS